jgi:hypothetical protein
MKKEKAKNPAAVALGRLGGLKSGAMCTPAQIRARRKNGKLGGRPKGSKSKPKVETEAP